MIAEDISWVAGTIIHDHEKRAVPAPIAMPAASHPRHRDASSEPPLR